jgi:hypothetical protein
MKKPFLLFALKCSIIFYFAACTGLEDYTTGKSATPIVTGGTWVIKEYLDPNTNSPSDFSGYTFTFNAGGNLTVKKNGLYSNGNWSEDDISKKMAIDLRSADPLLERLSQHWKITHVTNNKIQLQQLSTYRTMSLSATL